MSANKLCLKYNLQLFAKDGPGGEKTEEPTAKKLSDARKEGKVSKSKEIVSAVELVVVFATLRLVCSYYASSMLDAFTVSYNKISSLGNVADINFITVRSLFYDAFIMIFKMLIPVMGGIMLIGLVGNIAQVKWQITGKPLMPKLNKLNPISGFKRIFSTQSLINLVKSLVLISICFVISYNELVDKKGELFNLYEVPLTTGISAIADVLISIGLKISVVYLIFGVVDFIYQKRKFRNEMMMTKQEVKDEYKQTEGDQTVKNKQRQKMMQASRNRMMKAVPEADVVITNPTHFAVALKYDPQISDAPLVVAKGADLVAQRIKDIAKENNISIKENKPLARTLYFNVEVGDKIPQELYQAVAEILAIVYEEKHKTIPTVAQKL